MVFFYLLILSLSLTQPHWLGADAAGLTVEKALGAICLPVALLQGASRRHSSDGQEILLEDEPGKFARAVSSLLNEPSRRKEIGHAALSRVEKQYGVAALRDVWRQVVYAAEKIGR